jgi:hypothetical protein
MCFTGLNPLKILLSQLQMHVPLIKAKSQARDAEEVNDAVKSGREEAIRAVKAQLTSILDIYESYHTCISNLLPSYHRNGTITSSTNIEHCSGVVDSNEREMTQVIHTMEATRSMCASLYRELWKKYCK